MQIHQIKRAHALKKPKLLARGGKRGKTSGRGGKGQTARAGNKRRPAMRDIIKKLPKLRGYGKNRSKSVFDRGPEFVVNVGALNVFKSGDTVTPAALQEKGIIPKIMGKLPVVKILGSGELTVKLSFADCAVSESAKQKIESAGGTIASKEAKPKVEKKEKKATEATAKKEKSKKK